MVPSQASMPMDISELFRCTCVMAKVLKQDSDGPPLSPASLPSQLSTSLYCFLSMPAPPMLS